MALDHPALLELVESMRSADSGDLMRRANRPLTWTFFVGVAGFEPTTSSSRTILRRFVDLGR